MISTWMLAYIVTATIFLALDFAWLARVAKPFYFSRLGHLLRDRPRFGIAAAFYVVYVIGIIIFAVAPALSAGDSALALVYGALFGFFAYATYDITNYATLRDWPMSVAVVDVVWGTLLTGISAYFGALATGWLIGI